MKKIINLLLIYNLVLLTCLLFFGFNGEVGINNLLFIGLFIPVEAYFTLKLLNIAPVVKNIVSQNQSKKMMHFLNYYSFIFVNILFLSIIMNLRNPNELIFVSFFVPLELYFVFIAILGLKKVSPGKRGRNISSFEENIFNFQSEGVIEVSRVDDVKEVDRRKFFKLLAGAGVGVFVVMLLNPQKAGAAFFGSVPGAGTVGIKDSTGTLIDPAIKSPTDGYAIANTDTSSTPYYYGFVNKDGAWYIVKEVGDGSFLYAKGSGSYNWSNRASESYASFSATF